LPFSATIVWMIRSALSSVHFWARRKIRARSANPLAAQAGYAARARATASVTSSGVIAGTVPISFPVAGLWTSTVSAGCDAGAGASASGLPFVVAVSGAAVGST
jgi:hypothetical protein